MLALFCLELQREAASSFHVIVMWHSKPRVAFLKLFAFGGNLKISRGFPCGSLLLWYVQIHRTLCFSGG